MIEAPEPPHLHSDHDESTVEKSKRWLDRIMPISVLILSIASLFVALHTGRTMESLVNQNERMVRASSTPILMFDNGNAGDEPLEKELNLAVRNVGTGPARIVWLEMTIGEKISRINKLVQYAMDQPEVFEKLSRLEKVSYNYTLGSPSPGILAPNDTAIILKWPFPKTPYVQTIWDGVDSVRDKLSVKACYCSLFDECWESAMSGDVPISVKSCATKGHVNLDSR